MITKPKAEHGNKYQGKFSLHGRYVHRSYNELRQKGNFGWVRCYRSDFARTAEQAKCCCWAECTHSKM